MVLAVYTQPCGYRNAIICIGYNIETQSPLNSVRSLRHSATRLTSQDNVDFDCIPRG